MTPSSITNSGRTSPLTTMSERVVSALSPGQAQTSDASTPPPARVPPIFIVRQRSTAHGGTQTESRPDEPAVARIAREVSTQTGPRFIAHIGTQTRAQDTASSTFTRPLVVPPDVTLDLPPRSIDQDCGAPSEFVSPLPRLKPGPKPAPVTLRPISGLVGLHPDLYPPPFTLGRAAPSTPARRHVDPPRLVTPTTADQPTTTTTTVATAQQQPAALGEALGQELGQPLVRRPPRPRGRPPGQSFMPTSTPQVRAQMSWLMAKCDEHGLNGTTLGRIARAAKIEVGEFSTSHLRKSLLKYKANPLDPIFATRQRPPVIPEDFDFSRVGRQRLSKRDCSLLRSILVEDPMITLDALLTRAVPLVAKQNAAGVRFWYHGIRRPGHFVTLDPLQFPRASQQAATSTEVRFPTSSESESDSESRPSVLFTRKSSTDIETTNDALSPRPASPAIERREAALQERPLDLSKRKRSETDE